MQPLNICNLSLLPPVVSSLGLRLLRQSRGLDMETRYKKRVEESPTNLDGTDGRRSPGLRYNQIPALRQQRTHLPNQVMRRDFICWAAYPMHKNHSSNRNPYILWRRCSFYSSFLANGNESIRQTAGLGAKHRKCVNVSTYYSQPLAAKRTNERPV